ncbi:nSTAND1 domain-containing NTPase [Nocardiopsis sp. EMB25]|uniref:nSTAND1 domain-containing NTPase n=1 Tax=Nocardiopsis sp. EMB25 TaxID=2835867 RepID=UPI0022842A1D|nr:ATP-binding protein [Nocardiopsis sp. EMB25]
MSRNFVGRAHRTGPFVGARPFGARDRHLFHGRTATVNTLVEAWSGTRLTLLHGDAGVGKTSLLRAGAVPALTDRGARVLPVGHLLLDPAFPSAVLPEQNPFTRALLASWNPGEFPTHGPGTSTTDFLRDHERTDRYGRQRPLFAALDQTEPLLRAPDGPGPHRAALVDELLVALDEHPGLHLLLTVRTEHLADLRRMIAAHGTDHTEVRVGALPPDSAVHATARALDTAGVRRPLPVAERLVEEVRTVPGPPARGADTAALTETVDPALLQTVGALLYAEGSDAFAADDVDHALAVHLSLVLEEVAAEHLVPRDLPHAWLRRAAAAGGPGAPPPAADGVRDPDLTWGLVHTLQDRHLVAPGADGTGYRLRHPRLTRPLADLAAHPRIEATPEPWTIADRVVVARRAHTRGEPDLAGEHARRALRATPPPRPRERALLTSLLGDLAFERGDPAVAAAYYAEAAELLEAVGDGTGVARLLVAQSSSRLQAGQRAAALDGLRAAAGRVHGDPSLRTGIGQALWRVGQSQSALDVLDSVLVGDRSASEARRIRNRIRAELTSARGLTPRGSW